MFSSSKAVIDGKIDSIRAEGLFKSERVIDSPQGAHVSAAGNDVLNFCANNYLGLSNHPEVLDAAAEGLRAWGFGLASVRFICGTQSLHRQIETEIAQFLGYSDAIIYSSCFDANGGIFETLLGPDDAVISDELNHASIIDGIRLCKAAKYRYKNRDMESLRAQLEQAKDAAQRLIVTDGVFSMDGYYAPLKEICDLADEYDALVMVDDSHATGFIGASGRGSPERSQVADRVDIVTGTFGKALGGGAGGFVAAHDQIVSLLRQRSRPYLFSNSVAPVLICGTLAALKLVAESDDARGQLHANAERFREAMHSHGFELLPGEHPIVPVMFGDAELATRVASAMLEEGVYVTAFSFPVVPRGQARIRVQLSAAHSEADVDECVSAFVRARTACS